MIFCRRLLLLLFFIIIGSRLGAQTYTLNSNLGTYTTCSGTFVDGGGSGSNYASSSNYTVTFCSGSSANVVVSFSSFNVESGYDHLLIYDGPSTASTLVDDATGSLSAFVVQSSGSCITFNFTSDGTITAAGWVATISCVVPCTAPTAAGTITNQTAPVKVCVGEAINFSGSGSTAAPGYSIVSYLWDFDDGTTGTGVTTSHSYSAPGQYTVNLDVTDNNSCVSLNNIDLVIQVGTTPVFTGTTANQTVCAGQNVCLNGVVTGTPWQDVPSMVVSGTTALPDGSGVCYDTPLSFTEFAAGQTITSASQIQDIYSSIEHTWAGDLTITVICPNGQQAGLFNSDGTWNTTNISSEDFGNPAVPSGFLYTWTSTGTTMDAWAGANSSATVIPAGTYGSEQAYSNLVGCPLNGTWTLKICDTHTIDDGTVFYWGIHFDPSVYASLPGFTPTYNSNCTDTYWSGGNAASTSAITSTSADCDQICVTPPSAGVYSYIYTAIDDFGCSYNTTVTVTATAGPTVTVNSPTICNGSSATLTAGGATTYSWSSGLGTGNPKTVSPTTTTVYTVSGTTSGCVGTANATVTVNPIPVATATPSSETFCSGGTTSIALTSSVPGTTFSWTTSVSGSISGFSSGSGNSIAQTLVNSGTAAGTVTYTITPTANTCVGTPITVVITVNPIPVVTATPASQTFCSGGTTNISLSSAVSGTTFAWTASATGGITGSSAGTGSSISQTLTNPGTSSATVTYTITPTANTCVGTPITVTITVNPIPVVNLGSDINACPSVNTTLTATGGGTYLWNNTSTNASITVNPTVTTSYSVTVTTLGCTASDNITINVSNNITASVNAVSSNICVGQSTLLTASGGTVYTWSTTETTASITVSPTATTVYSVTVGDGFGCSGSANIAINVQPQITITTNPATICAGQTANLTASGGLTYYWSTTEATQNINVSPLTTSTYYVTVTDNACTETAAALVTVNPLPTANAGADQTICSGESANLTASGGTSYQWNTTESTSGIVVSPSATSTYTVTVTNSGCTASDDVLVTVASSVIADAGLPQAICVGESATLTASGGSNYQWDGGPANAIYVVSPSATTTYTVTVSSGGCSGTDDVLVTINASPTANAGTDQIICSGQSANLTAFGGGTYEWSNMMTTQSTNVSPATTTVYTVTVTSIDGCTDTDEVQVTVNTSPTISAGPDQSICEGASASITASGGSSYSWSSGENTGMISVSPSITTTYTVTGTDINGCSNFDSMILTVNPIPVANAGLDQSICEGSQTGLAASGGVNYQWSPTTGLSSSTISNPTANPTTSTIYGVTVSDAAGCSSSDEINITVNPVPTSDFTNVTPICVAGYSEITYTGTGTPAAVYNWDFDGGTVLSGSGQGPYQISWPASGTYDITLSVTENGCTSSVTSLIQEVGQITVSLSVTDSISCNGSSDGSVTALPTGSAPYTYSWSDLQSSQTAVGLSANTMYTVTVTDNFGCTASQSITLSEPQLLSMTCSSQNVLCFGGSNGFASATVNGGTTPYQYIWSPSGTAGNVNMVSTLQAGIYTLTVVDAHGCSIDTSYSITEPPAMAYTYSVDSVNCNGGSDGSIIITPSGGNPPYAFIWSPNVSNDSSATSIPAGNYLVTINDHNGCSVTTAIAVYQPNALVLSNSGNVSICNGQSTTISASAMGGTGSYTFTWDNGLGTGSSFSVNPTSTTTYNVTVTDGNGCTATTQPLTVSVSPPISVMLSVNPSSICDGESATISATANGGNGNYTYTWGTGIGVSTSTITVTPNTTTTYPVTVTDDCNSPQGVDSITVTVFPLPQISFIADTIRGCEPLGVNFTDQTTPSISSWLWDFGDPQSGLNNTSTQQNPGHLYSSSGTYSVTLTVTTTNGCSGTITYTNMIEVYPTPDASFYYHPEYISIFNPYVDFIDLSTNAYTWDWNFGDPASMVNNNSTESSPTHYYNNPGTYTVTLIVTSQYGCVDSVTNDLVVHPEFTFYAPNAFTPDGNGNNDYFYPEGEGFDLNNYEMYVYDRWGEMIFKTNDYNEYWDGKVMGSNKMCPQGVYVWVVILKDVMGEKHYFDGRVTLISK